MTKHACSIHSDAIINPWHSLKVLCILAPCESTALQELERLISLLLVHIGLEVDGRLSEAVALGGLELGVLQLLELLSRLRTQHFIHEQLVLRCVSLLIHAQHLSGELLWVVETSLQILQDCLRVTGKTLLR